MARRYSESSTDSWSLVERRSSVESSDEEEGEIVARDVYDEYENESIGQDSMDEDTDFSESETEDEEALEDAVEQEEEEEEDVEMETIHEEEALADSAARHFVAAEKVVERFDELADSCDSPMEEALFTAVSTPERMRLFVVLSLTIVGCIVLGLERSYAANMNLITPQPQSEFVQAGLPSREYVSRIGVVEVREFLDRRQLLRTPPKLETYGAYEKAFLKKFEERKMENGVEHCAAVYYNTTISIRSPTSNWSQCSQADAPVVKPSESSLIFVQMPNWTATNWSRKASHGLLNKAVVPPPSINMGTLVQQLQQPKKQQITVQQQPKKHLQPKHLQPPCTPSAARPCKPSSPHPTTKVVRPVRPTKIQPLKPTTAVKPVMKYSKSPSLSVYRNYSVARVYQDKSSRRDPKPFKLPNKSLIAKKPVEKKKVEAKGICQNTVLDRMKKRREQQKEAMKKMNNRSVPPPVIYANASASHSKALMRKSSYAAGHCDRRNVQEFRPLPCISYKEQLPCLAPPPRRLISGISKKKSIPTAKTTTSTKKVSRSPKKEYIRRIPLV